MQANGFFPGTVQRPTSLDPYSTQAKKGMQNSQVKIWQAKNPEHRPPTLIKFMAKFMKKYSTPYFAKVLITGNKTVKDLPKYRGNLHGKRDMCIQHILAKYRNPNFSFYHAQAKYLDAQYAANVCTVIAPGMEYFWRHGAADIHMPAPVVSKCKMEN